MNQRVLSSYNLAIQECADLYGKHFRQLKSINTDNLSQNAVSYDVTIDILVALSKLISEQIGFFDRSVIEHIDKDAFHYSDTGMKDAEIKFNGRAEVENNDQLIQPIPVAVIVSPDKSQALIVRKKNNATRNGSAERGKDLFYFGGHVRLEDKQGHHSNLEIFQSGLLRELKEELGLDYVPDFNDPICILDRSRQRMKHIAICTICTVDFNTINFKGDGLEFRDASLKKIRQSDFRNNRLHPERWSQLIIQHVLNWTFI